jgi:hypothetical protein
MVRDTMIAIGIAFWGFLTSSPAVWTEKYQQNKLSQELNVLGSSFQKKNE